MQCYLDLDLQIRFFLTNASEWNRLPSQYLMRRTAGPQLRVNVQEADVGQLVHILQLEVWMGYSIYRIFEEK